MSSRKTREKCNKEKATKSDNRLCGNAGKKYDLAARTGSHSCCARRVERPAAGIALHKLAHCYERGKDLDAAARCYEANLAKIDAEQLQGRDAPDALLFLANYKKVLPW